MRKREYDQAFGAVRDVIHEWDPYGLLLSGAPPDEFDREAHAIVRQLGRIHSALDAGHVISRVFSSSFEAEPFQVEHCRVVGERLFAALVERGMVGRRT
ncbi:MAG: DUF1871 family protein [Pyrinomonadaceae bacterium]